MQVWNDQDENDETLAMVVRTGTHTAVGSMLQSHSCETRTLADHLMFKVSRLEHLCTADTVCATSL